MKNLIILVCLTGLGFLGSSQLRADESNAKPDQTPASPNPDTRYGLFNGLDHRSSYGQFFLPEPFLIDDSDLESRELRLDWLRTAKGSDHSDNARAELEYGVGVNTFELEVPYEREEVGGSTTSGVGNISIGVRRPFYQAVSRKGLLDTTFGAGIELGIPTTSDVSHNTELVPKIFNDTRIGNFTMQTVLGHSFNFGPGEEGGVNTFEYGFVFGYVIPHETLSLPGIERLIPVAELKGETQLNKSDSGHNILYGDAGFRLNLKTWHGIQARPGVVFVFPLDAGARDESDWGIMTSLVFEF